MPGPGDAATWPTYTGHPNDPRRTSGFDGSITDTVSIGIAGLNVRATVEFDDGEAVDWTVKTPEGFDLTGYISQQELDDITRQIGTKHGV